VPVSDAARLLCISASELHRANAPHLCAIERRSASLRGKSARGVGLLLKRCDVERVASIRRRCHVSLVVACRIWVAIKTGGPL
jgi:hypothetical protein